MWGWGRWDDKNIPLQLSRHTYNSFRIKYSCNNTFIVKLITLIYMCFRFLATLVLCGTQLGNYAVNLILMTLDQSWGEASSSRVKPPLKIQAPQAFT